MRPFFVRLLCLVVALTSLGRAQPLPVAVPRLTHPGAGQTLYFVLTDRFANGNPANDTGGYPGGPEEHGFDPTRIGYYHGGDFAGLTARLDYLKNLGVTAVWVTPPFRNKPVQRGSAGYHGYWVLDFLHIDPHLGTDAEFQEFVRQAHARGLKVFMDIIINHTADVIQLSGDFSYRDRAKFPFRDAAGRVFDDRAVAYNGVNNPAAFPALSAEKSFPYVPVVPAAEAHAKNPEWLNDPTLYHNRGNNTWVGESATLGDFVGLDDLFTAHPRVVQGFIEVFTHWLRDTGVDGFRIDTAKHVNGEFWQAFIPAIRAEARKIGRPDFLEFGEVYSEAGDPAYLSEFSTGIPIDTTLDFGFFAAARKFVSQNGTAAALADFIARDDYYTDHDSNVHATTTFLGNHDAGRFGYFLQQDNPGATLAQLADLEKLGHGLLLLSRGQPVIYYGDEQGMVGRGGGDMQAREDMFAAQAPDFKNAPLLATNRTGADDKFDEHHPFYRLIARLGALRAAHPALRTGAMIPRATRETGLFAFSRLERGEKIEYLVALNNSRTATLTSRVPTSQPGGARLARIFDSRTPDQPGADILTTDEQGEVGVTLAPLQFAVWQAGTTLGATTAPLHVALVNPAPSAVLKFTTKETDGQVFVSRQELRAEVTGGDGYAEVTFVMQRASRPGQYAFLGTDDTAPYRIFWTPPPDLAPDEELEFIATVNDLRGHQEAARVGGIRIEPSKISFGIAGAKTPQLTQTAPAELRVEAGAPLTLTVQAVGSGGLEYQWLRDGELIPSATSPTYTGARAGAADAGQYRVLVHNLAGTALSPVTTVQVTGAGRIVRHPAFPSALVPTRNIEVWLPPGYDENATERYPVIYMHDGQNIFDPGAGFGGVSWEVDRALCRLIKGGKTRGAIVVGVANTGMGRFPEYMPRKAALGERVALLTRDAAIPTALITSDAYLKFLVEELKPWVDRTYRTEPDRTHTFVMGSSMGGLISAYAICEYPEVFGGAGCVSTHLPAGDGAMIAYLAKHLPAPGTHKLYFDYGTETLDAMYEPYQLKLDGVLRAAGYTEGRDWITKKFPGAEHSERAWRQRVDVPLSFLLGL
ncbi:MAG: alpha-amylase family glycosyl hydrolase [bacterium]|nr:alpha-amylase family glycosyl hydrolase [bacterium]MDI1337144.1 alpha-amylase family glycosyl hydrolase [Lacunisphaera sp.]